jgi:hypothetical protein
MPSVRIIRFARVNPTPAAGTSGAVPVAQVMLDEQAEPAGRIMRSEQRWEYLLADGAASGLASSESRQELERQVILYYLGALPSAQSDPGAPPFKLAM